MANLTVDGDSDYSSTGTPDTFTAVSDGPSGTDAIAAHINGIATAITELQTLLGNGLTLKGSVADLVTRLSRIIGADGALQKGTSFPGTPIDGQPFYRTDLNTLYIYDAGTTSWTIGIDSGIFALVDGTREFTGDVKIEKSTPALRLRGTESSADDVLFREDTGVLYIYRNTGSEGTPTWTEVARFTLSTGVFSLTGAGGYKSIFSHNNTADRTYTLPNFDWDFLAGTIFRGPTSIASGSTRSLETFSSATGNLSGIHYYDGDFTLDSGHTLTVPAGKRRLIIIATGTITINGTITAAGAGGAGASGPNSANGSAGESGTDQAAGSGSGSGGNSSGAGGSVLSHGITIQAGGAGSTGAGAAGTQITGASALWPLFDSQGGAGGSGSVGVGVSGATGGNGGGSIILIAPTIVIGASAVLNTSGSAGGNGTINYGGAGGGAAGNISMVCRSYTDNGGTFTLTGGAGGSAGSYSAGGAGAAGIKQINVHA